MKPPKAVERLIKETWFNAAETTDKTLRAGIARATSEGQAAPTPEPGQTRRRIMKMSVTRIAIAAIVCGTALATAVGMKLYRYHYQGQDASGSHIFRTDPELIHESTVEDPNGDTTHTVTTQQTTVSMRPEDPENASVEQMQADLEEIDQLRQRDARRLIRTVDTETENDPIRVNVYEYTLSDGRTITMAENDRSQE